MVGCTTSEEVKALPQCNTINGDLHTVWPISSNRINWNRQAGLKVLKRKCQEDKYSRNRNSPCHR